MMFRRSVVLAWIAACGPSPGEGTDVTRTTGSAMSDTTVDIPTEPTGATATCGNGIREGDEACDDGTADAGDECDEHCEWRRREQWYMHIDDGGRFGAIECSVRPRSLAVTPDLFAVHVGCVRTPDGARARQVAATPAGDLAGRTEWDGKVEWVLAPDVDKVLVSAGEAPEIRTVAGALLGTIDVPTLPPWTAVQGILPWSQDGYALALLDSTEGHQRFMLFEEDEIVLTVAVVQGQDVIVEPHTTATLEASGAVWGTNGGHAGYFRINTDGLVDRTVGAMEAPTLLRLAPDGGFVGARTGVPDAQPCSPWLPSRVWRWSPDDVLLWTADDCDGDEPDSLGRIQIAHIGVDGLGDVLVAGTALADDGQTPVGATLLKLAGATGERVWQTTIAPGPGYEGTVIDAVQIGADNSIYLAGRESSPAGQDAWMRRIHP